MTSIHSLDAKYNKPSMRERIEVLPERKNLFEHIDNHPQSGIHDRFGKYWAMVLADAEREVHRCWHAVNVFFWDIPKNSTDEIFLDGYSKVMGELTHALFHHGMYPSLAILYDLS